MTSSILFNLNWRVDVISRFYTIEILILRAIVYTLSNVEVADLDKLPPKGPFILVTNHINWTDSGIAAAILPHRMNVFIKWEFRHHPIISTLFMTTKPIWLKRGTPHLSAIREALNRLSNGEIMAISPEGTRSETGILGYGHLGAAFLAVKSQVPIVPMVIFGQETAIATLKKFRKPTIQINIGDPFHLPPFSDSQTVMNQYQSYTELIMKRLAALLPEKYRGRWGDAF